MRFIRGERYRLTVEGVYERAGYNAYLQLDNDDKYFFDPSDDEIGEWTHLKPAPAAGDLWAADGNVFFVDAHGFFRECVDAVGRRVFPTHQQFFEAFPEAKRILQKSDYA